MNTLIQNALELNAALEKTTKDILKGIYDGSLTKDDVPATLWGLSRHNTFVGAALVHMGFDIDPETYSEATKKWSSKDPVQNVGDTVSLRLELTDEEMVDAVIVRPIKFYHGGRPHANGIAVHNGREIHYRRNAERLIRMGGDEYTVNLIKDRHHGFEPETIKYLNEHNTDVFVNIIGPTGETNHGKLSAAQVFELLAGLDIDRCKAKHMYETALRSLKEGFKISVLQLVVAEKEYKISFSVDAEAHKEACEMHDSEFEFLEYRALKKS